MRYTPEVLHTLHRTFFPPISYSARLIGIPSVKKYQPIYPGTSYCNRLPARCVYPVAPMDYAQPFGCVGWFAFAISFLPPKYSYWTPAEHSILALRVFSPRCACPLVVAVFLSAHRRGTCYHGDKNENYFAFPCRYSSPCLCARDGKRGR